LILKLHTKYHGTGPGNGTSRVTYDLMIDTAKSGVKELYCHFFILVAA